MCRAERGPRSASIVPRKLTSFREVRQRLRAATPRRVPRSVKAYYDRRAQEYDDWWLGGGLYADRERPGWERSSPGSTGDKCASGGADARRRLWHRLPDPAPPGRGRRPRPERADAREARKAPKATFLQETRSRCPSGRLVRPGLHRALLRPPRGEARERSSPRPGASLPSSSSSIGPPRGRRPEERQDRVLKDGSRWEVYKRFFEPGPAASSAAARAVRGPLVRRRPLLTRRRSRYRSLASLQRDNRVCRACAEAGFPLESLPVVEPTGPARVHLRPGAGRRRGRGAPSLARPCRAERCGAGSSWRRTVLRDLLLCVGDALLPGTRAEARRPNADAARAGALRLLARVGASADPAGS